MTRHGRMRWPAVLLLALGVATAAMVRAQAGGDYELRRSVVAAGGARSTGGDFALTGSIGQDEADPLAARSGQWSLQGGFWGGAADGEGGIFADGFE